MGKNEGNYMTVKQKWWLGCCIFLSITSFVFSIVSLCNSNERILNVDYIGIIGSILGATVTVLIGWNIYSIIDFKDTRKRIFSEALELKNEYQKSQERINHLQSDFVFFAIINDAKQSNNFESKEVLIDMYFDALNVAVIDGLEEDRKRTALNELKKMLTGKDVKIKKGMKPFYRDILYRANDTELYNKLDSVIETNQTEDKSSHIRSTYHREAMSKITV